MGATVLYMSVSLDGFIAGPNVRLDNGLGDGGGRLHEWVLTGGDSGDRGVPEVVSSGVNGQVVEEFMDTGAVVAGRNVLVHGAATAQLAPAAGLLDEMELHELERTRVLLGEDGVNHLHYRVHY